MRLCAKFIILAFLAPLAACGPRDTPAAHTPPIGEAIALHRGNGAPDALSSHGNEENSGAEIPRDLFEGLTTETVDARTVPGTAQSWTVSDDGLVYTFSLRPDARWCNGDPVVAKERNSD